VRVPIYAYVMVGTGMLAAAVLMILAGRRQRAREGTYNGEAIGFVGGVFNALFIVVLAFYTVITWTAVDATEQQANSEAAGLIEVYWQAAALPEPDRQHIRALIQEYTEEAAGPEWAALDQGESSAKADELIVALRAAISSAQIPTEEAETAREMAVQTAREVSDQRRARIEDATGDRMLLTMLLVGTAIGAVVMIGFPLLIGFTADARNVTSLVVLAAILGFVIYFSVELDHPFSGLIKVEPDTFDTALTEYQRIP
jgi:hypothetical protein